MRWNMTLQPESGRGKRWRIHRYRRGVTSSVGGRNCMTPNGMTVTAGATAKGNVHLGGLQRCGSPWACPICAPIVREGRAAEIDQAVTAHREAGGDCYFVTATVKHSAGVHLDQVLALVAKSWRQMMQASASRASKANGYIGQIRSVEITHGANGWHPHVHAVFFFEAGTAKNVAHRYLSSLSTNWAHAVSTRGGSADVDPAGKHPGWIAKRVTAGGMGDYLSKVEGGWGIGLEVARSDVKKHNSSTKPFEFLERAADGDVYALRMWLIYEQATKGKRAIVFSKGLKDRFGIVDLTDEQKAEAKLLEPVVIEAVIPSKAFERLYATGEIAALLDQLAGLASGLPRELWRWPAVWLQAPNG